MTPPNAVGFANGIAQSIVSLARCFGPVLGGYVSNRPNLSRPILTIIHKLVVVCQYTGQPIRVPPWVHSLCWRLCVLRGAEFHDSVDESIAFSFSLPTLLNTRYFTNTFPSLICFCSLDGPTLSALFIHVAYRK